MQEIKRLISNTKGGSIEINQKKPFTNRLTQQKMAVNQAHSLNLPPDCRDFYLLREGLEG